jgi:DNA replication ATP-dependent helicase Dna2
LLKEQLLKGVIKSISNREVTVSLRNKLLGTQFLEQYGYWTLESDFLEHSYKRLPAVLFDFLKDKNFDVKVGRLEQKISTIDFECDYLNEKQTEIVKAAIEADNYYLIQGPPGTGKTSFVLRSIVEHYYRQYRKPLLVKCNILLAAYTNRAVDQICTVLKEKTNIKFIRLGSKESSEHSDVLLSEISADYGLDELDAKFNQTRVVVATVASLLSHSELFDLKYFDLAIVDEAAQILEPYVVNVINKCGKCIMIGDEKQLPAIVSQSRSNYMIENETLSSIEMNDLSASYFQRMLKNAKKNGWTHSYGMLTDQGRMGESIMQLSNELFYQNKLLRLTNMEGPLNEKLSFYGVEAEEKPYLNYAEANYVVRKIAELKGNSETKDMEIGVISPFRTQCSLIKNLLPEELKNEIAIDTVEKFQGSERDVIFISFAVNKAHHLFNISSIVNLEGYEIDRKLNVAITRARQQLYVTGCKPVLEQSPIYKKFIGLLPIEN